ncbi:metal ABC transporter substrate-binding protein [Halarsenatibacter silvermanii]|uniref:Zinc transport system substrate-binding protein n=1 Tax=Halarsenatibacter silvermanii TaxID=321763 RepID=A0A1G9IRH2_9FIRM|nr:zinc ABC transporter substrate-binding protein [Halarsenatibacter silvermanii]SDL27454.1 zinc transport system substrate-binding protein [Halarsenatibacter silvermanii]
MKKIKILLLVFIFALTMLAFISLPTAAEGDVEEVEVRVSIHPIYAMAERIAGDRLQVEQVAPHGIEIHGFEPSPRQIAELEGADAFIFIGSGLEPWGERAAESLAHEGIEILELAEKVELRPYGEEHDHDHDHDEHGHNNDEDDHDHDEHGHDDHEHGEYDTHIWLDFEIMQETAAEISNLFASLDPEGEEIFQENMEDVQEKLASLDRTYQEELADRTHDDIIVSHAAFGYIADNYGLNQHAVTGLSPHDEPSPRTVSELIETASKTGVDYILMEKLASPETVNVVADEAGLEILQINPGHGLTEEDVEKGRDYFDIMHDNLENLKKALDA